jgi:ATP synthase protein I
MVVRGVTRSLNCPADIVRRVMTGDQTPPPAGDPGDHRPDAGQGWTALAYLIGGMSVWGFIGWLVDQRLDTGGVATGIGVVLGMAGGIYLVVRRLGTPT